MKEKLYKICGKKLNKKDTCETIVESLDIAIALCNGIIEPLKSEDLIKFAEEAKNKEYKSPLYKKMIEMLNNSLDKGMEKEKEKALLTCKNKDLDGVAKDVSATTKSMEGFANKMNGLVDSASKAIKSGDDRYAYEMLKFVNKSCVKSNEIFEIQQNFAKDLLQEEERV